MSIENNDHSDLNDPLNPERLYKQQQQHSIFGANGKPLSAKDIPTPDVRSLMAHDAIANSSVADILHIKTERASETKDAYRRLEQATIGILHPHIEARREFLRNGGFETDAMKTAIQQQLFKDIQIVFMHESKSALHTMLCSVLTGLFYEKLQEVN